MRMDWRSAVVVAFAGLLLGACGRGGSGDEGDAIDPGDLSAEVEAGDADTDTGLARPVANSEAAALGFQLYYRERVDRLLGVWNRFMMVGDTGFGVTIGRTAVARDGDAWELVPGPTDNNLIGTSTWTTWYAYRLFRTRALALSLVRMFDGLVFLESTSGHPGVTARMVYPGWTRVVDGAAATAVRTRGGIVVGAPTEPAAALNAELLATFWPGGRWTYREDPSETFFSHYPAADLTAYAITYSFDALPTYLRVSDCCTSLMRTPAPHPWEGAFWGNHNSRDNFPDLGLGFVAALAASRDPEAAPEVRAAALRAVAAGQRVGDLMVGHDAIMTVDEHHDYDTLVVSGHVRPDGETEIEDLGSLDNCGTAYLARALATSGLALPVPAAPLPGSLERILVGALGGLVDCPLPEGVRECQGLDEAYCGLSWGTLHLLPIAGRPWLELIEELDVDSPGAAEQFIGSFQDDYFEVTTGMLAVLEYARASGQPDLAAEAQRSLGDMTGQMRRFADVLWTRTAPERRAERRFEAALLDGAGGLPVVGADVDGLRREAARLQHIEALLEVPEAVAAPLKTDIQIREEIAARLPGKSETVRARYAAAYGDTPPLRRAGDGYEARGVPEALHPWRAVARPRHVNYGGFRLLEGLPLCVHSPELIDCTWAALGCAGADVDGDGRVGEADAAAVRAKVGERGCGPASGWCGRADLDRTGAVDAMDVAFAEAAQGCWYTP
jgi:hypothetical protein